jgi:transcriptional regulator with XRE-family HTH domain
VEQKLVQPTHSPVPVGTALKLERIAAGIRQFDLADRLGMDVTVLSRIESGRRPVDDELADRIRIAIAASA